MKYEYGQMDAKCIYWGKMATFDACKRNEYVADQLLYAVKG